MEDLERVQSYFKKPLKSSLREENWSEQMLTSKVAAYLREHHPSVPFQIDLSGEHLSKAAALRASKNRAGLYHHPDLVIYVKRGVYGTLMLELKKLSAHPLKKDGTLKKNSHLEAQARSIIWLRNHNQCADFSVGFEETVKKINDYLTKGQIVYTFQQK